MDNPPRITTYLGVALVSMAALANEVILTRIFSVALWHHFAFSVISLALLGSGAAGVWLHLGEDRIGKIPAQRLLVWLSLGFAAMLLGAFMLYTLVPLAVDKLYQNVDLEQGSYLALIYLILTLPYLLGGATLAAAIRANQSRAGLIYFADLAGAGLGCLASVFALNEFGGAGAVLVVAVIAALGSVAFALAQWQEEGARPLAGRLTSLIPTLAVTIALGAGLAIQRSSPWLAVPTHGRTYLYRPPIYEAWNAFSKITVYDDTQDSPFGWGISPVYKNDPNKIGDPSRYIILIDEKAGTPILHYNGVPGEPWYEYLRWDMTALPYYLRDEKPSVFVIGPGGGRDVVTAYEFGARQITGVELNPLIVDLVRNRYGDYSGHIYDMENVNIVVDDARTYLASSGEQYDIIQASLIDTMAASSAGAFALSENGIYTREAFLSYYEHLTDNGVVNFSRWYYFNGPAETLRLVAMGLDAWQRAGVADPRQNIIVLVNGVSDRISQEGLAGMLLKKTPFTLEEIERIRAMADQMGFVVLYMPGQPGDNPVSDLITSGDYNAFTHSYPLEISPPTDDRPFFFNIVRLSNMDDPQFEGSTLYHFGVQANRLLVLTLAIVVVLAAVMILLPLGVARRRTLRQGGHNTLAYILYFAGLGLGFILVEVPMLQRLTIYLGSPTYALVVVLFSLLIFSGLGSSTTQRISVERTPRAIRLTVVILLAVLALYILGLPLILKATQGWPLGGRIALVVAVLMPAGLLMGRPFPLAVRFVGTSVGRADLLPWLWAINSALSVVGSVLAVIIAISFGFSIVFLVGMAAYALVLGVAFRLGTSFSPA